MQFMTEEEGSLAVRDLGGFLVSHPDYLPVGNDRLYSGIPADSGAKNFLARVISQKVKFPCLLWLGEFFVWESSGNWPLANLVRRGLGEQRPWHEAPVLPCNEGDRETVQALVALATHNIWDIWVIEPQRTRVWHLTHDEGILLYADSEQLDDMREFFEGLDK